MKISYQDLKETLEKILMSYGFSQEDANQSAGIFADTTADGVPSHGVNRFPLVISYIQKGFIDVSAKPEKVSSLGAIEKWKGNLGMGNLNATICMDRAMELASKFGIGAVALSNTNHWMRGGSYGHQAAQKGFAAICWTNTMPNMPAWGARDRRIGNNPLVIALPRNKGEIVFDAALAQFSYGKIESTKLAKAQLPFPGGYNEQGELTTDPDEITKTWRVLPIGFWKGSGLSIVLDLLAASLSEGNSTYRIGNKYKDEIDLCQVFIAIDLFNISNKQYVEELFQDTIDNLKQSIPVEEGQSVRFPGEGSLAKRKKSMEEGIEIDDTVWKKILELEGKK